MRKTMAMLLCAALAAGLLSAPARVANAGKKKKKSGPVVVGTDPDDDWGTEVDPTITPAGDVLGQELVGAAIGVGKDGKTIEFIIKLKSLPPIGGAPEVSRYSWDFSVDAGDPMEIDGKFTNYSRGVCDPTSGQCPPPRDPGLQPFMVRGNCGPHEVVSNFVACEEFALVQGIFDVDAATITVPVPMEAIKAKPGSKITGALGTFDATITAAHSAFATSAAGPMDRMITTKTFVVPK